MNDDNIQPINDPKEMPSGLSDEEQLAYWETHGLTEDYLQKTEEVPEDERPRARTRPVSVRFDAHALERLKTLADRRGVGYQTLLKEFVTERLYEEEKRERITPLDAAQTNEAAFAAAFATTYSLLHQLLTEAAEVAPEKVRKPAFIRMIIEDAFREGWSRFNPGSPGRLPWLSEETPGAQANLEEQRYYPAKRWDTN